MKKIMLTACVFVLCVACGLGLTACSVGEVKENTSAVIETSTGIIPVEYSQGLATNLLQAALTNLNSISYSYTIEGRNIFLGAFQDVENPGYRNKITFINDYGNTSVYLESNSGQRVVLKVLKNASNQSQYYQIDTDKLKYYELSGSEGNITMTSYLKKVTDGMCYNGISYINGCRDMSDTVKEYFQFQIKDGLIRSCLVTCWNVDTMKIISQQTLNFSYENIEKPVYLPDTVAGLERLGYQLQANN